MLDRTHVVLTAEAALEYSVHSNPWTAPNSVHAAAVTAAVLREVADGLCCGGVLYDLADQIAPETT